MGGEVLNGSWWTLMNFALYTVVKFDTWKQPVEQFNALA